MVGPFFLLSTEEDLWTLRNVKKKLDDVTGVFHKYAVDLNGNGAGCLKVAIRDSMIYSRSANVIRISSMIINDN